MLIKATPGMGLYVLDSRWNPVPAVDAIAWAMWFQHGDRQLAETYLQASPIERIRISTVFLGIDHSFNGGTPILWETMVFGGNDGEFDWIQDRYYSRAEALAGHLIITRIVRESLREGF